MNPSSQPPGQPYAPPMQGQPTAATMPQVASLPGMPPVTVPVAVPATHSQNPGVNIHISNVMGPAPNQVYPYENYGYANPQVLPHAYAAPTYPYPTYADPAASPTMQAPQVPLMPAQNMAYVPYQNSTALAPIPQPSMVNMMRTDASQRAIEAVARRGPTRIMGYGLAITMGAIMLLSWLTIPFGAAFFLSIPCVLVGAIGLKMGLYAGRGLTNHHLEQAILHVAAEHNGLVRVTHVAQATGRPLRECQLALDALVQSGHAMVDSDEHGSLFYRVPDLETNKKPSVIHDVTAIPTEDAASSPHS